MEITDKPTEHANW